MLATSAGLQWRAKHPPRSDGPRDPIGTCIILKSKSLSSGSQDLTSWSCDQTLVENDGSPEVWGYYWVVDHASTCLFELWKSQHPSNPLLAAAARGQDNDGDCQKARQPRSSQKGDDFQQLLKGKPGDSNPLLDNSSKIDKTKPNSFYIHTGKLLLVFFGGCMGLLCRWLR